MLSWKTLNSLHSIKYCKGTILGARVYADVKGGKCTCGGSFTKRVPHADDKDLMLPVCEDCNKNPALYRIDADSRDVHGIKKIIAIRHTKDNERLDSPSAVAYIIKVIQKEMSDGSFNLKHYASKKSKASFIFENYVEEYLEHQERRLARNEITPKGLHDKKGLIRREILPYFGKKEIFRIDNIEINKFKDQYITKLRTRDLALCELKALLNQAERDGVITRAPKFDPIPRAKVRDDIIPKELAIKTIEAMPKEIYRDMYTLLLIYPIRPGELRALMWKDVDLINNKFVICQHFSNEVLTEGRKSVKKGKKEASISFDIGLRAREIFLKYRTQAKVVSLNQYVFLSRFGRHFAEASLWEAWNQARKRVGHNYAPYECRHVSASDLYEKLDGNLIRMKDVGGWTNTSTLERYVYDRSDNSGLFQ